MAHFLEHLVFKGGEVYDDYRKVNETAEQMGAMLNAYTSHDIVAFHLTCRAEVVGARDRPADGLRRPPADRRGGARPRARRRRPGDRALQRPAVRRRRAPDRPRRVRRPPARAARCSAPTSTSATFTRDAIVAFRGRQWAGCARRRLPGRQPRARARRRRAGGALRALPVDRGQRRLRARAGLHAADARRGARLQPVAPAHLLPPADRPGATASSAPRWRSTRRCSAARWARACSTRSASSAGWPTPSTPSTTRSPTSRSCSSRPGSTRPSASRPTRCMREIVDELRENGPRADEFERARAYAAGRRVLAFENTNAVARYAANQTGRASARTSTPTRRSRRSTT